MRLSILTLLAVATVIPLHSIQGQSVEELKAEIAAAKQRRIDLAKNSRIEDSATEEKVTVSNRNKKIDLSEFCYYVQLGGLWTFANKEAFIHIPPHLKTKLVKKPAGKHIPFKNFVKQSRGVLITHELTDQQAYNGEPIAAKDLERIKKSGAIVVATHKSYPSLFRFPDGYLAKQ